MASAKMNGRLPAVGRVGLRTVSGDLNTSSTNAKPDCPETPTLVPHRVGPSGHQGFDVVRSGVGGEVEIGVVVQPAEHGVAHHPADEVEAESRGLKPGRECVRLIDQGLQAGGDHGGSAYRPTSCRTGVFPASDLSSRPVH